jgi:hypothetical protein
VDFKCTADLCFGPEAFEVFCKKFHSVLLNPSKFIVSRVKEVSYGYFSQAIKITLSQGVGGTPHDLRPYRLLVSLLDKPDIGPAILDDILYEVFR